MRQGPEMSRVSPGLRHKATASTCDQKAVSGGWWIQEILCLFPLHRVLRPGRQPPVTCGSYESGATTDSQER